MDTKHVACYNGSTLTFVGNILEPEVIMSCVHQVMKDSSPPAPHPVGVFTAENRDTWATYRDKLIALGKVHGATGWFHYIMILDKQNEKRYWYALILLYTKEYSGSFRLHTYIVPHTIYCRFLIKCES